jgi:dephospho-CoA kinase
LVLAVLLIQVVELLALQIFMRLVAVVEVQVLLQTNLAKVVVQVVVVHTTTRAVVTV